MDPENLTYYEDHPEQFQTWIDSYVGPGTHCSDVRTIEEKLMSLSVRHLTAIHPKEVSALVHNMAEELYDMCLYIQKARGTQLKERSYK